MFQHQTLQQWPLPSTEVELPSFPQACLYSRVFMPTFRFQFLLQKPFLSINNALNIPWPIFLIPLLALASFLFALYLYCLWAFDIPLYVSLYPTYETYHSVLCLSPYDNFLWHNTLQTHPLNNKFHYFISSSVWVVFHCVYVQWIFYPFICPWVFG